MQFKSINDFHIQKELYNNPLTLPYLPNIALKVRRGDNEENVKYNSNLPATYHTKFFQNITKTQHPFNKIDCYSLISFHKLGLSSETPVLEN